MPLFRTQIAGLIELEDSASGQDVWEQLVLAESPSPATEGRYLRPVSRSTQANTPLPGRLAADRVQLFCDLEAAFAAISTRLKR